MRASISSAGDAPVAMINASAVAGAIGAGGLGDLAYRYGYQRFDTQVMIVVIVLFFKEQSLGARLAIGLLYALLFIPLTYWIDRFAYRNWQRRGGRS